MKMRTELHRHLDISLRMETLLELAQERGLEAESTSLQEFRKKIVISRPMTDLSSVLARFQIFQQVLDRPEVLERVAFEAMHDCAAEGTTQVELRFSPGFVCELSHLAWEDALDGFESGMRRALRSLPEIRAGLICIASREYGIEGVERTIEFFLKHRDRFIGFDLAGNEVEFPSRKFEGAFRQLTAADAKITIHAGEAAGPENIWEAIELLGARRIGHGVSAIRDPKLVELLVDRQICVECCPTSNWITGAVRSLENHPLPLLLKAGVPVTINTDDPTVFGVDLPYELDLCRKIMGFSTSDIEKCNVFAARASFLS
ncbi:MAG TPA: adenosine deaminase [Bdellovibrionota bacterium]|nr:adenosine deaminase [Bdellovibrionota bacterium]